MAEEHAYFKLQIAKDYGMHWSIKQSSSPWLVTQAMITLHVVRLSAMLQGDLFLSVATLSSS